MFWLYGECTMENTFCSGVAFGLSVDRFMAWQSGFAAMGR